jgi:hypothetical protein
MKKRGLVSLILLIALFASEVQARSEQLPVGATAVDTPASVVPPSTTAPGQTIQTLANQAQHNTNHGQAMANAAIAVTTVGTLATCWNPSAEYLCKYFVGGLVASIAVRMFMGNASSTSAGTGAAVTTPEDPYNLGGDPSNSPPNTAPAVPDYTREPDYQKAQQVVKNLQDKGWKIDVPHGAITTPDGKSFTTGLVSSADSMRAAGGSPADIAAYQSAMAKIPALAEEKTKAADASGDMFGDSPAGGGGKSAASADGGVGAFGSLALKTGPRLGVNRDPAQVVGMKKNFNGDPIGVAQDSLFYMIDRRYELHQKNGSFLSQ